MNFSSLQTKHLMRDTRREYNTMCTAVDLVVKRTNIRSWRENNCRRKAGKLVSVVSLSISLTIWSWFK
jgi:hypothetical protein